MPTINPAEIVRTRTGGILKSNILLCYEILLSSENCREYIRVRRVQVRQFQRFNHLQRALFVTQEMSCGNMMLISLF